MKKFLFITLALVLISGIIFSGCAKPAPTRTPTPMPAPKSQPVILKYATVLPPMDPYSLEKQHMCERFNERAQGRCKIEYYPGGQLCEDRESFDLVAKGAIDITENAFGTLTGHDRCFGTTDLPFSCTNLRAYIATTEAIKEVYAPIIEKFNQKVLAVQWASTNELISTRKVKTLEDWKGLRVLAINPAIADMVAFFGGSSVSLSFPYAYVALQKKIVDAAIFTTSPMVFYKLWNVAQYVTISYMFGCPIVVTINMDVWNSLPEDIQKILLEENQIAVENSNKHFLDIAEEDPKTLEANGIEVYFLPQVERERWEEVVRPYVDRVTTEIGPTAQLIRNICEKANMENP